MPKTQDEAKLAESWRELCGSHARVSCALEKTLQAEHALTPSEFDVLELLAGGDEGAARMQDLAGSVHLSQSALSRLVGRLEADGLVERAICAADRRGIYAHLTEQGRARYEAARPTHRRVLAELLDS